MGHILSLRRVFCSTCLLISGTSVGVFSLSSAQPQGPCPAANLLADAGKFQEPPNVGHYYYADPGTRALSPLERRDANQWVRKPNQFFLLVTAAGYVTAGYEFPGAHSSFRIKSRQPQEFVIRFSPDTAAVMNESEDVMRTYVWLSQVKSKKDKRQMETVKWPVFAGEPDTSEGKILCAVQPYGNASFLISPREPLPPGEYAFIGPGDCHDKVKHLTVFTFGIDPQA